MGKITEVADEIYGLEVLDTHTHLIGDCLCAQNFWEIADYFWLARELQAGGCPENAKDLPEKDRISAFLEAYHATRNTMMNIAFTLLFKDLYGIAIRDEQSVREADMAVQQSSRRQGWADHVAAKLNIRRFVVNYPEHAIFSGMGQNAVLIPRIDGKLNDWFRRIQGSSNPHQTFEHVLGELASLLDSYAELNCPGIMTTLPRYTASSNSSYSLENLRTKDEVLMLLLHKICEQAEKRGMFIQMFLGVERSWCKAAAAPVNDTERIVKLYGLFEQYACPFELVVASELNNLDVVQAAWNFPNVHVGGMWWYNFRASTYRNSMQYRLEALPAMKSSLIVSDARCIEWAYAKTVLVKKLLAEFLQDQMERGWLDKETAIRVARGWLFESAANLYRL